MKGFTLSAGIGSIPNIEKFLGIAKLCRNPLVLRSKSCTGIYSWGHKPYSKIASRIAHALDIQHTRLEDGFVCSFGRGGRNRKYSIVIDSVGIYYDATSPSRLENILNNLDKCSWQLEDSSYRANAEQVMKRLIDNRISKYNVLSDAEDSANDETPFALVVDQTVGDQSVRYGGMQQEDFDQMLKHAVSEHSAENVRVKVHPDVLAGRKQGYLSELASQLGVKVISSDIPPHRLRQCTAAYTGTSLYGFELLMHNVPVVCFGQPFYSGWGVTEDKKPIERRKVKRSLLEMFIAAYLIYPTYVDPVTGKASTLAATIDHIIEQRRQVKRVGGDYRLLGITPWKKRYVDRYMMATEYNHQYVSLKQLQELPSAAANEIHSSSAAESPTIMVWGRAAADTAAEQLLDQHKVARMEDGFVRSVGLGSNFTAPRSLVVDDLGIYFDATKLSRLEYLLENRDCSVAEIGRAESLIELLLNNGISKYTSADCAISDISFYAGKRVLLVVGQVQGDASLRYGSEEIDSNIKLLQAVRANNPDSLIVYKPHPDVVSGNRSDGISNYRDIQSLCDHIETGLSIEITLNLCEQVHTMTSLAGLEALLCGKEVVTYGKPFYAGWGLTRDHCEFERRTRKRSLAELVYICYIEYPGYLDIESGEFTSVEKTIASIVEEREMQCHSITATGIKKYVNIVRNIKKGLTYAA